MEISQLLLQIDQLKTEIDELRPLEPAQERQIMQKFRLDWTYHSNAVEGNTLTYGETKAFLLHGITAQGKPFRDYLEVQGHHKAINHLLALIDQQKPLTEADIRELHKIILVEPYDVDAQTPDGRATKRRIVPGQYKTMPNHVVTSTGEMHYYASPEETPAKMGDLMAWYRRETGKGALHCLILAVTFHYQFVVIHPFDDGNGRMARLLMNLILMQCGYPPVIIPLDMKNVYLLALEMADADDDLNPFVQLVGERLLASMNLFLRGAAGEDIEDSDDLDKKLALLERKLDYTVQKEQVSHEAMTDFYQNVLTPFLKELIIQLNKFNRLFKESKLMLQYVGGDLEFPKDAKELLFRIEELLIKTDEYISWLKLTWQWKNLVQGYNLSLALSIRIMLQKDRYEIRYGVRNRHKPLMQGAYKMHYSQDEIQKFVRKITDDILETIEEKTSVT